MNKKMSWIVGWTALAAFVIVLPHLLPNTYFIRILNMVGIYILLATGSNILTGYAGQLSMGQAAFYGVGAYTVGLMSMYLKADFLVILPVAILVACVFGIVLAVPALRLKGGYLTLLTIGFAEIFRLVMNNWGFLYEGSLRHNLHPDDFRFGSDPLQQAELVLFHLCGCSAGPGLSGYPDAQPRGPRVYCHPRG